MFETVKLGLDFLAGIVVALTFALLPALCQAGFQPLLVAFLFAGLQAILVTLFPALVIAVFPGRLANLVNVGADEEVQNKIFKNMSKRAAGMLEALVSAGTLAMTLLRYQIGMFIMSS